LRVASPMSRRKKARKKKRHGGGDRKEDVVARKGVGPRVGEFWSEARERSREGLWKSVRAFDYGGKEREGGGESDCNSLGISMRK